MQANKQQGQAEHMRGGRPEQNADDAVCRQKKDAMLRLVT
jgi:hypothetical protein